MKEFTEEQKERGIVIALGIVAAWTYFKPRLARFVIVWALVLWTLDYSPLFRDETDAGNWGSRSGFYPSTDAKTGCQYLISHSGISPRMTQNGEQMGCKYTFDSNGVQQ